MQSYGLTLRKTNKTKIIEVGLAFTSICKCINIPNLHEAVLIDMTVRYVIFIYKNRFFRMLSVPVNVC